MSIAELIEKEKQVIHLEYEIKLKELKAQMDFGSYGKMDWIRERTGLSANTLKEKILYPFRKELEGRIVSYADKPGVPWRFNKYLMNEWLVENFDRIEF